MLFNKQHCDMSTCKYNRINSVYNKNNDCEFENCDWQGTSYSKVCLAIPCWALLYIDMPLFALSFKF